jgi:hypothetical protein
VPADPGPHQKPVLLRQVLQHLAVADVQAERGQPARLFLKGVERQVGKCAPPDFRKQRLLPKAGGQLVGSTG